MTATEDELVAAISKSYNNFLNRLVNGEASATMQLGNIEFVMDYRFIMERQFRYEGLVSEHYPRMTPVFPLLFVQILLGKWETFTDLEGECCNPTMSSTAVSDEEENVTDDGDTAGRTLLHKPSPLEKSRHQGNN